MYLLSTYCNSIKIDYATAYESLFILFNTSNKLNIL